MYSVIASAVNHPDGIRPYRGLFNHRILRSLVEEGTPLDVVSPRPFAPPVGPYSSYAMLPETEDWGDYTVHRPRFLYLLPKRFFYGLAGESFAKRVPRYLERTFEVPDVVHACHIYLDGYGMLPYCRKYDVPLFVIAHGKLLNTYNELPDSIRSNVRETLEAATGVLCVSDDLANKASRIVADSKVTTVPIGASPDRYPVERSRQLREELDIPRDTTVVLFVGELTERKGLREIIALLPNLDLQDVMFVFVGHGGEMENDLRRALAESRYSNRFLFTGMTSLALRRWYAMADLLWLPSHAEGRPTVIYEAMASKTAVLASAVGGIPEQVIDGETGVLVPPGDERNLERELRELIRDPERLTEMGEKGHRHLVDQDWTWSGHAKRVQELHRASIGK